MVAGHTQAIDGALLKANASKDSLEIKKVDTSIDKYLSEQIKANTEPRRPAAINRAPEDQQHMQGDKDEQTKDLKELNTRYQRQAKQYQDMPADAEKGKFLSNKTHYSPTDPDARIAVKPGKPRELYYSGQIAVDTGKHVITHAQTMLAEGKDGDCLKTMVNKTKQRLEKHRIKNFTAMRRINTRGLQSANKCLIMAAACYNLKKWMKHITRTSNMNLQVLSKEAAKLYSLFQTPYYT